MRIENWCLTSSRVSFFRENHSAFSGDMQPASAQGPPLSDTGPPTAATAQKDLAGSVNGSTAENAQTKFSISPVHVVPAPSFSYTVRPNTNAASPAPVSVFLTFV